MWYDIRMGKERKKKEFLKLHVAENIENGLLVNCTVTEGKAHDSLQFKKVLEGLDKLEFAVGDSSYLSQTNCRLVEDLGGKHFKYPSFQPNSAT